MIMKTIVTIVSVSRSGPVGELPGNERGAGRQGPNNDKTNTTTNNSNDTNGLILITNSITYNYVYMCVYIYTYIYIYIYTQTCRGHTERPHPLKSYLIHLVDLDCGE